MSDGRAEGDQRQCVSHRTSPACWSHCLSALHSDLSTSAKQRRDATPTWEVRPETVPKCTRIWPSTSIWCIATEQVKQRLGDWFLALHVTLFSVTWPCSYATLRLVNWTSFIIIIIIIATRFSKNKGVDPLATAGFHVALPENFDMKKIDGMCTKRTAPTTSHIYSLGLLTLLPKSSHFINGFHHFININGPLGSNSAAATRSASVAYTKAIFSAESWQTDRDGFHIALALYPVWGIDVRKVSTRPAEMAVWRFNISLTHVHTS